MLHLDKLIGYFVALPIFWDVSSSIFLANSALGDGGVALPLSILFFPMALALALLRWKQRFQVRTLPLLALGLFFVSMVIALGAVSSSLYSISVLYALQWVYPFLWIPYFASLATESRHLDFLSGLFWGALTGATYIFSAGVVEWVSFGALLDGGRMTQNLILPGQYQLYVYTPTMIAYSALLSFWIYRTQLLPIKFYAIFALLTLSLFSLVFIAAREGILVFLLGLACLLLIAKPKSGLFALCLGAILIPPLLYIFGPALADLLTSTDVRLFSKLLALSDEGRLYAGRDEMMGQYIDVFRQNMLFGTKMLPPSLAFPALGVHVQSAHNYYVDVFAWSGLIVGLSAVLLISVIAGFAVVTIFRFIATRYPSPWEQFGFGIAILFLLFVLVSNNINVPLRQPLTGPLAGYLIATIFILGNRKLAK